MQQAAVEFCHNSRFLCKAAVFRCCFSFLFFVYAFAFASQNYFVFLPKIKDNWHAKSLQSTNQNYNVQKIWFLRIDMSKRNHKQQKIQGTLCAQKNDTQVLMCTTSSPTHQRELNILRATAMHLASGQQTPWCESPNQSQCNELRCKKPNQTKPKKKKNQPKKYAQRRSKSNVNDWTVPASCRTRRKRTLALVWMKQNEHQHAVIKAVVVFFHFLRFSRLYCWIYVNSMQSIAYQTETPFDDCIYKCNHASLSSIHFKFLSNCS